MNLIPIAKDCFSCEDVESSQLEENAILESQKEIISDLRNYLSDQKESESGSEIHDISNYHWHFPKHLKYAVNLISLKEPLIPLIKKLHKDNMLDDF